MRSAAARWSLVGLLVLLALPWLLPQLAAGEPGAVLDGEHPRPGAGLRHRRHVADLPGDLWRLHLARADDGRGRGRLHAGDPRGRRGAAHGRGLRLRRRHPARAAGGDRDGPAGRRDQRAHPRHLPADDHAGPGHGRVPLRRDEHRLVQRLRGHPQRRRPLPVRGGLPRRPGLLPRRPRHRRGALFRHPLPRAHALRAGAAGHPRQPAPRFGAGLLGRAAPHRRLRRGRLRRRLRRRALHGLQHRHLARLHRPRRHGERADHERDRRPRASRGRLHRLADLHRLRHLRGHHLRPRPLQHAHRPGLPPHRAGLAGRRDRHRGAARAACSERANGERSPSAGKSGPAHHDKRTAKEEMP